MHRILEDCFGDGVPTHIHYTIMHVQNIVWQPWEHTSEASSYGEAQLTKGPTATLWNPQLLSASYWAEQGFCERHMSRIYGLLWWPILAPVAMLNLNETTLLSKTLLPIFPSLPFTQGQITLEPDDSHSFKKNFHSFFHSRLAQWSIMKVIISRQFFLTVLYILSHP